MIHALVANLAYGEPRRWMLTRRCPRCGYEQLRPEEKLLEAAACATCEAPSRRSTRRTVWRRMTRTLPRGRREEFGRGAGGRGGQLSRRVNRPAGHKRRRRRLIWDPGTVALVTALLYRELGRAARRKRGAAA